MLEVEVVVQMVLLGDRVVLAEGAQVVLAPQEAMEQ
jgi:hypothetical protein